MNIEITTSPSKEDEDFVISQTRAHAESFMPKDSQKLCLFLRNNSGKIFAGLTGMTYWNSFNVSFLWVDELHRGKGHGSSILKTAEEEVRGRGCLFVQLDTFSFQALDFYKKLGYKQFGQLPGFTNNHVRYYLCKTFDI